MSILVTGANGFVGRHLIRKMLEQNIQVKTLSTKPSKSPAPDSFKLSLDSEFLSEDTDFLNGVNCIIHLAGLAHRKGIHVPSEEDYMRLNFHYPLKLARLAVRKSVKRFVFISTIGVNGKFTKSEPFCNDSLPNPQNVYSNSKLKAEIALQNFSNETGLEVVIIRPPLVYGYDAPGNFATLTKLIRNLSVLPFGLVSNKRNFISVQNLVDLLLECALNPNAAGHVFLASDAETISLIDFTNAIANGLNKNIFNLPVPVYIMKFFAQIVGKSEIADQLFENLQIDSSKTKNILGWTPPLTMVQSMSLLTEKKND